MAIFDKRDFKTKEEETLGQDSDTRTLRAHDYDSPQSLVRSERQFSNLFGHRTPFSHITHINILWDSRRRRTPTHGPIHGPLKPWFKKILYGGGNPAPRVLLLGLYSKSLRPVRIWFRSPPHPAPRQSDLKQLKLSELQFST